MKPVLQPVPLCVDLDGTLVHSDLLIESALALLKKNLLYVFLFPLWLLSGKAVLKREIARRVALDITHLPYNEALLTFLRQERTAGRYLVLATAAHADYAQRIADYLDLFDEVLATDGRDNLAGNGKLLKLQQRYGNGGFDYIANDRIDLIIWAQARRALIVTAGQRLVQAARQITEVEKVFPLPQPRWRDYGRMLRLHQWLKNSLIFVPLVSAHWLTHVASLLQAGVAFLAFSLCASSVYLLNDLLDLAADRQHPRKRQRPFAAGLIPLQHGLLLIPLLLVAALLLALWLPWQFLLILGGYYALTLAYSLGLKQIPSLDVITLALLYTTRIIAGIAAIGGEFSPWLLGFSMFMFLSLALVKRYAELQLMLAHGKDSAAGRGYQVDDLPLLQTCGAASGYVAVLVLALYITSPDVKVLYAYPQGLWLLCPALLYWITRTWLKTHRGEMHDDPVVFAATDRVSQLLGVLILATVLVMA